MYMNEPKHYHHLPNMLLFHSVLPKQRRPMVPRFPVVAGTKTLVADPTSAVGCVVELPWIELVGLSRPTDAQLN